MAQSVCRWGIVGTANIARKNWKAIGLAGNATLVAVASRDRARAEQFVVECQQHAPLPNRPDACGTYDELLARSDIEAVYIPLPTGIRKEWVIRAAEAGKHVLCEKPCAVGADDLRAMIDACKARGVQFMDGVMFIHSQRLPLLRQVLDDGQSVGELLRVTSQFSFKASDEFLAQNIRVSSKLEPLGSLGDLGWYNIRFSLWAMQEKLPERVTGRILAQHAGTGSAAPVPVEFSSELLYANGVSASFFCSFRAENQQWAVLSGSRGYVQVPDFVLPFFGSEAGFEANAPIFRVNGCDFNMESHPKRFAVHEYSNGAASAQEVAMIRAFSNLVIQRTPEPRWAEQALKTQIVLEACLRSALAGNREVPVALAN